MCSCLVHPEVLNITLEEGSVFGVKDSSIDVLFMF